MSSKRKLFSIITGSLASVFLFSLNVFAAGTSDNPFIQPTIDLLNQFKNWILALGAAVTVAVVSYLAVSKQVATQNEKDDKVRQIRNAIIWGVGITFVVWLTSYIITFYSDRIKL